MTYERLRRLREQQGWSIAELEQRTGVRARVLELIDRGAFGELPTGLYGRSAIRAYAKAVGLPPDTVVEELSQFLPAPEDPLDGLARVRGLSRKASPRSTESNTAAVPEPIRHVTASPWRPLAATGIDAALLGGIALAMVWLTALACGTTVSTAMRAAAPAIVMLFTLIACLYFVLLGGVRNATVGARIAGVEQPDTHGMLDARAVFARAGRCAIREGSVLVDWMMRSDTSPRRLMQLWVRRA